MKALPTQKKANNEIKIMGVRSEIMIHFRARSRADRKRSRSEESLKLCVAKKLKKVLQLLSSLVRKYFYKQVKQKIKI